MNRTGIRQPNRACLCSRSHSISPQTAYRSRKTSNVPVQTACFCLPGHEAEDGDPPPLLICNPLRRCGSSRPTRRSRRSGRPRSARRPSPRSTGRLAWHVPRNSSILVVLWIFSGLLDGLVLGVPFFLKLPSCYLVGLAGGFPLNPLNLHLLKSICLVLRCWLTGIYRCWTNMFIVPQSYGGANKYHVTVAIFASVCIYHVNDFFICCFLSVKGLKGYTHQTQLHSCPRPPPPTRQPEDEGRPQKHW